MRRETGKPSLQSGRLPRPRLPVCLCGLALVTAAYGYCREASPGLLILAALATILATALPRSLPPTARAVVWNFLLVVVLGAAANIGRITADNNTQIGGMDAFLYDRVATFAFAAGILAIFFRPSSDSVTVLAVSIVPAWLLTLERGGETAEGGTMALAGVSYALIVLAAQFERVAAPRAAGMPPAGQREWSLRLLLPAAWFCLTVLLTPSAASLAAVTREWLYGLAGLAPPDRFASRRLGSALSVASPESDLADRVDVLMEIDADTCPGYLRESVYRTYALRQWSGRSVIIRASEALSGWPGAGGEWNAFALTPDATAPTGTVWTFRPRGSRALASLCLPGAATGCAMADEHDPLASSDGIVSLERAAHPPIYQAHVDAAAADPAFPAPDPAGMNEYLAVPSRLAPAVTNWVRACAPDGLPPDAGVAMAAVAAFFRNQFTYRLGTTSGLEDPLVAFMDAREGHCSLFASATALMLRVQGIPTRVVAGYLCSERHPYTGRWVVRKRDGHAWCEAWDAERGRWILVEATPSAGLPDEWPPPGRARLLWERVTDGWRRLVERIREANPLIALAVVLAGVFVWCWSALQSPVGAVIVLATATVAGAWVWRHRRNGWRDDPEGRLREEVARTMARLERQWAAPHLRREGHEPWSRWWSRVEQSLPADRAAELRGLLEAYQTLRYREPFDAERARSWLAAARREKPTQAARRSKTSPLSQAPDK